MHLKSYLCARYLINEIEIDEKARVLSDFEETG